MASKLTRLPWETRLLINQRLRDGQTAPQVLPWINGLPEMRAILAEHYAGEPVSPANLTGYRKTEYAEWVARQEQIEHTKQLAHVASGLAAASGEGLSQGMLAVLIGKLMEALDDPEADPEATKALLESFPKLSNEEVKHQRLKIDRQNLLGRKEDRRLKQELLDQQRLKLELATVDKFWEWHGSPAVQALLEKPKTKENMAELRKILFGDRAQRRVNAEA